MSNYSDWSTAPTDQSDYGDLIPNGTLAWGVVLVRPHNAAMGKVLVPSNSTEGNAYLDLEVTIEQGSYARRKVWTMPGLQGSDAYVSLGRAAVRHILEVGREITDYAPGGAMYQLAGNGEMVLMALSGLRCAVKIGVEKAKIGTDYSDKNKVAAFLSPNPESNTYKDFMRLVKGETAPPAAVAPAGQSTWGGTSHKPAATAQKPAWGATGGATATGVATTRPAWAGSGPPRGEPDPAQKNSEEIPF